MVKWGFIDNRDPQRCQALIQKTYSPDLHPIEQVFAKLKVLLRKAAERTHERLWRIVVQLMDHFHLDECLNFFRDSGYVSN
jgi:transposase